MASWSSSCSGCPRKPCWHQLGKGFPAVVAVAVAVPVVVAVVAAVAVAEPGEVGTVVGD